MSDNLINETCMDRCDDCENVILHIYCVYITKVYIGVNDDEKFNSYGYRSVDFCKKYRAIHYHYW